MPRRLERLLAWQEGGRRGACFWAAGEIWGWGDAEMEEASLSLQGQELCPSLNICRFRDVQPDSHQVPPRLAHRPPFPAFSPTPGSPTPSPAVILESFAPLCEVLSVMPLSPCSMLKKRNEIETRGLCWGWGVAAFFPFLSFYFLDIGHFLKE